MRSSLAIQYAVIRALFLREAVTRLAGGRMAWFWLLLEPMAHLAMFVILMGFILKRVIPGADPALFIATGLAGYFMFSRVFSQCKGAIASNLAMFTYRQVKPIDTLFARAFVEGFLFLISVTILFIILAIVGKDIIPAFPLEFIWAIFLMWFIGLGFGMVLSVCNELTPGLANVIDLSIRPLYFLSAVMYPVASIPEPYRGYILLNPLVHGIESIRHGFFERYHSPPEVSLSYLFVFALIMVFLGLALQIKYEQRLITA
jgi:capsular polysaccharide transport system permease protein